MAARMRTAQVRGRSQTKTRDARNDVGVACGRCVLAMNFWEVMVTRSRRRGCLQWHRRSRRRKKIRRRKRRRSVRTAGASSLSTLWFLRLHMHLGVVGSARGRFFLQGKAAEYAPPAAPAGDRQDRDGFDFVWPKSMSLARRPRFRTTAGHVLLITPGEQPAARPPDGSSWPPSIRQSTSKRFDPSNFHAT